MHNYYNVVVVGKTGVGKSSFINYIYGEKLLKTGAGKPVTKRGFESITAKINDLLVRLYDSWGLEADKADEWMKILELELKKRSYNENIEDWFHTVFYCISAGSGRIEEYDLKIIRKFLQEKYYVSVILTKADQCTHGELEELKRVLWNEIHSELDIIPVISEEKVTRTGKITPEGKTNVECSIENGFWDSIARRIPEMCVYRLSNDIEDWYKDQVQYIDNNLIRFKRKDVEDHLNQQINALNDKLNSRYISDSVDDSLRSVIKYFSEISNNLFPDSYYPFSIGAINKRIQNKKLTFGDYASAIGNLFLFNFEYWRDKGYGNKLKEQVGDIKNEVINKIQEIKPEIEGYIHSLNRENKVV